MKFSDTDFSPVQAAIDAVNAAGCTYASLTITSTGKSVAFQMYTPETNHHRFDDSAKLIEHLSRISGEGEDSIRLVLAKERIQRARNEIAFAQDVINEAEALIACSGSLAEVDADGVPV